MVIGYQSLPEFWTQGGYRLPLFTIISDSGLLPVTNRYHNFGLRVVDGYKYLSSLTPLCQAVVFWPENYFFGNQVTT